MSSIKHRHLGRKSSHRSALLRNLVTSLIETESIRTTWPRAKEAQRVAEKLITLGKRNTNAARQRAQGILFRPDEFLPKLFGPLRLRYANRPGGYTRVLRTEPLDRDKKHKSDDREYNPGQPESAILELVDGPRDMRFAITARALVRQRGREEQEVAGAGNGMSEILAAHVRKVTRFRDGGEEVLEREVRRLEGGGTDGRRKGGKRGKGERRQEKDEEEGEDEGGKEDFVERTPQGNDLFKERR